MPNHEKVLESHASTAASHAEVTQKLQDDARSAPIASSSKPITQPSDDDIRKLLNNPQEFKKLYDKYYRDMSSNPHEPDGDAYVTKETIENTLENPNTGSAERLIAAASLAGFDHLAHALGEKDTLTNVPCLDGWTGTEYAKYMGGETKAQLVHEKEKLHGKETDSFGHWINNSDNPFLAGVGPFVSAGTAFASGAGIYGAALALGTAPAVGLAVLGGAAAVAGLTAAEYGINKVSDYLHESSKYDSITKELKNMTQSASLPSFERNTPPAH